MNILEGSSLLTRCFQTRSLTVYPGSGCEPIRLDWYARNVYVHGITSDCMNKPIYAIQCTMMRTNLLKSVRINPGYGAWFEAVQNFMLGY